MVVESVDTRPMEASEPEATGASPSEKKLLEISEDEQSEVSNDEEPLSGSGLEGEDDEDSADEKMELELDSGASHGLATSNEAWADAMQKILKVNKPKRKKTVVLAKAKKLSSMKAKEIKQEAEELSMEIKTEEKTKIIIPKDEWMKKGRVKPDPLERNREKRLQKVAVRGVIQLFNAVTQLQKNISTSTPSTFQEEKKLKSINKDMFLSMLKGSDPAKSESKLKSKKVKSETEDESEEDPEQPKTWDVLKNNFMTSNKFKNWDVVGADAEKSITID